jgi:hypothetical protein
MRHILSLLFVSALLFTSCEGDQGPPGFDGLDGLDGGLIVSSAFEIEVDFNQANNYEIIEPYGFDVFPFDVTLVYILWETSNGQDIWRLVPQSVEFLDGTLTYNFDFTQSDVRLFLDGTTDFSLLAPEWTQNQVFRVVVIPAENVDGLDISDINAVMKANNIESFIKKF